MNIKVPDSTNRESVEMTCSSAMPFAGVHISGAGAAGSMVGVLGNRPSVFGGVLLPWSIASRASNEAADETLCSAATGSQLVPECPQSTRAICVRRNISQV